MVVGGPLPRGGRRPLLLRAAVALGLLAAPIAGQLCTVNEWNAATRPDDGRSAVCIDPGATPPLPQIDLWEYRCPIEGGEVGDFEAGKQLAVIESVPVCDPDNPATGCRVYMAALPVEVANLFWLPSRSGWPLLAGRRAGRGVHF